MRTRLLALALATVGACKASNVSAVNPSLQVTPQSLSFPLTAYGTPATSSVTLSAITGVDVECTVTLDGGGGGFSISPSGAMSVSTATPITVTFAPALPSPISDGGPLLYTGALGITSNDPDHPFVAVPLRGTAQAPELDVCWMEADGGSPCLSQGPLTVEFGTLAIHQSAGPREFDLEDLAKVPLTVSGFALDSDAQAAGYSIVEVVTLPVVLSSATGLTDVFHIALTPQGAGGAASGHLIIQSDDPRYDGGVAEIGLNATVQAAEPPTACLGIAQIQYIEGTSANLDPAETLGEQPTVVPPGPLDTVVLTAEVSATCSFDPQDGQNLAYSFALTDPRGSEAAYQNVSGHTEERSLQFDLAGNYLASVAATDSAQLTATADLTIPVVPQSDLEAQLWWDGGHQVDLDLHLVRALGDAGTDGLVDNSVNDCFWCDCLLATNYHGGSPCGTGYGTSLQWGALQSPLVGNPLLVANQGYAPLQSENFDDVRLNGPQPGATYGLYAHYYQTYAPGGPASCSSDQDCTDPVYASCWANACVPTAMASLRIFVAGHDLFDGGPPLTQTLREPCDLWHAGDVRWVSGGHLPDGGFGTPVFVFTAVTADGGLGQNSVGQTGLVCGTE